MGWFCTTSFRGDAFQMGSVESFFTLLLSSLHLALSLTAWWSLSLSLSLSHCLHFSLTLSLSPPLHTGSHTLLHTHMHNGICDKTHSGKCMCMHTQTHLSYGHRCACKSTHTHTRRFRYPHIQTDKSNCMWCAKCACYVPAHVWKHWRCHIQHVYHTDTSCICMISITKLFI